MDQKCIQGGIKQFRIVQGQMLDTIEIILVPRIMELPI